MVIAPADIEIAKYWYTRAAPLSRNFGTASYENLGMTPGSRSMQI
jgi:hypothetical protein